MEGYASNIEYTLGYYQELNPAKLNMSAVLNAVEPIAIEESFNYCELGSGQGLTSLILAANYPQGNFYAIDYSPSHIARAKRIAKKANLTNITFLEKSFQELIDEPDLLPNMEFIVFHGIYTWVNDTNRANLVELCKRHLNSSGMVYNSYNAKPEWSGKESIQKLIYELSNEYKGSNLQQIESVLDTLDDFKSIEKGYFNNPSIQQRIDKIKTQDKNYVVHEYLHEGWRAFFFPEVSKEMEKAKLSYLTQASPTTVYEDNIFFKEIKKKLNNISSINNKELLKDMFLNTQFRKDLYTRGISKELNSLEQYQWFANKQWILLHHKEIKEYKFTFSRINMTGKKEVYDAIINNLKKEILTTQKLQNLTSLSPHNLLQALVFLYISGYISIYSKPKNSKKIKALNKVLADTAFEKMKSKYVIAGNLGEAQQINSINMAFLSGVYRGIKNKNELIEYVYQEYTKNTMILLHDNKKLSGDALKERISTLANIWQKETLPLWERIGIL